MLSKSSYRFFPLSVFVLTVVFLVIPAISHAACTNIPMSGGYTVSSSCTFSHTVDGVDGGGITVASGATLTINAGQTIVWSPGSSIVINGSIAIANGAHLKQGYIWYKDADGDGYPDSLSAVVSDSQPGSGYQRRGNFTKFTSEDAVMSDCDPSNANAWVLKYKDGDGDGYCNGSTKYCVGNDAGYVASCAHGYTDCNDANANVYRNVSSLVTDSDHDGYTTGSAATQCVGASSSINGRTYYKNSSGSYTYLTSSASKGTDCNDSNASLYVNRTCYPDADGDGYYAKTGKTVCSGSSCPSGYSATVGNDCCDSDANAHPGASYHTSKDACASWDWNCDGSITVETKYHYTSCQGDPVNGCTPSSETNVCSGSSCGGQSREYTTVCYWSDYYNDCEGSVHFDTCGCR